MATPKWADRVQRQMLNDHADITLMEPPPWRILGTQSPVVRSEVHRTTQTITELQNPPHTARAPFVPGSNGKASVAPAREGVSEERRRRLHGFTPL